MKVREASIEDWKELLDFYTRVYRKDHPLQTKEFWVWQYGNKDKGRAFICLNDEGKIVGHVGANFGGGFAWIINVFLDLEFRGKGVLRKLYDLARQYYPLAASAANQAGLGLYRNMRWFRYHDLVRYVKINPKIKTINVKNVGAIYSWDNIPKARLSERTNEIKYSKFSHWFEIASLEKEWDNYQNGQQDSSFHVWQWLNYIQIVN